MRERARGLLIFHGNRLEWMSELLLEHVAQHPLPALAADLWVVQGAGMKAWLEAQAAQHPKLGILAATRIVQPAAALWEWQRAVLGPQSVPSELPLDESRLVWRLMAWLANCAEREAEGQADPIWQPLLHHLAGAPVGQRHKRQYQLARQLADVYDAYQTHRPDWLRDWAQGLAQVRLSQGRVRALAPHQQWQAQLWAELVQGARTESGLKWVSRDQVFEAFLSTLRSHSGPAPSHWPERMVLLGVSALPIEHIQALGALSRHVQVLVFALNPSSAYWGDATRRTPWPVQDLAAEPSAQDHPLLASWGQQARDFLHLVDEADPRTDPRRECFMNPVPDAPTTLGEAASCLQHLQADILSNRHPQLRTPEGDAPHASFARQDDSLIFCQTHGALREVQALHDQVLLWMAQDPTLEPRDIVVMVSDLSVYEPLVRATWGRIAPHEPGHLPFQMARTHPEQSLMLDAVQAGLDLLLSPMTLGDVFAWLAHPAVMRRFDLNEEDLAVLNDWLLASGVRWGLDADHALAHGWSPEAPGAPVHTWSHGLERLLISQAVGEGIWQDLLTLPEVRGVAAECLNGLVRCLDSLRVHERASREPRLPAQWVSQLTQWLSDFHLPCNESQEVVLNRLRQALGEWLTACEQADCQIEMPLSLVSAHWLDQVRATQTSARLIGGGVVFTSFMPLQSVPFKRVCLLGLNDRAFPRERIRRDFDLMDEPGWSRPGDRARHDDDRYLLLQAILSARDGMYVSWQGFQAQDGKPLPASVLVQQWLEVMRAMTGQKWPVRTLPLQAHGKAYFELDPKDPHPWQTHSTAWQLAREQALQLKSHPPASIPASQVARSSGASPPNRLRVQDLMGWLRHPIDAHLRQRLGVQAKEPQPALPDSEAFELSALSVHQWVQGASLSPQLFKVLQLSGELPVGSLGELQLEQLQSQAEVLRHQWTQLTQSWQAQDTHLDVELNLPSHLIQGRILGLQTWQGPAGEGVHHTHVTASKLITPSDFTHNVSHKGGQKALRPRLPQLLRAGVTHVLSCAQGHPVHTHLVGPDATFDWPSLSSRDAEAILNTWCDAHAQAWLSAMPVLCDLAGDWLTLTRSPAKDDKRSDDRIREQLIKRFSPGSRIPSWDFKRHPLVQRFLPHPRDALVAIEAWAPTLYLPLIETLHVTVHQGPRHRWVEGAP